jgi:hypothetical protein
MSFTARGIGLKVLTGHGASIDTTFPDGKLASGIFAALAEFERTKAVMAFVRAGGRGRNGGRPYKMAPSKLRLAVASMNQPRTRMGDLCAELGITLRMRRSIRRALTDAMAQLVRLGRRKRDTLKSTTPQCRRVRTKFA